MQTYVLGCGNLLAGDDAIGIHVVREMKKDALLPAGVEAVEVGTPGLNLLRFLEDAPRVIIIDAIQNEASQGFVQHLSIDDLAYQPSRPLSVHEIDLTGALLLGRKLFPDSFPEVKIIGITIGEIKPFFIGLSPAVEAAIPAVKEAVLRELRIGCDQERKQDA